MPSAGYYAFLFVSLMLARPLIACLYAGTQALAALLLAPQNRVHCYLGGYGDGAPFLSAEIGRFELWLSWRLIYWPASHCDFADGKPVSVARQAMILLAGPAAILLFSFGALWLLVQPGTWGLTRFVAALLLLLVAFHLFRALLTRIEAVPLTGGGLVLGDGERLGLLLRYRSAAVQVLPALWHWEKEEFSEVAELLETALSQGVQHKDAYEYLVYSHIFLGNSARALALHAEMVRLHQPDAADLTHLAHVHLQAGAADQALQLLDAALLLRPGHHVALSQRGWLRLQQQNPEAALADLDRALHWEPEFAYAHAHRGCLHLQQGDLDAARIDLQKAREIDPMHNRTYLQLGVLYRLSGDENAAVAALETARLLAVPEAEFSAVERQFFAS